MNAEWQQWIVGRFENCDNGRLRLGEKLQQERHVALAFSLLRDVFLQPGGQWVVRLNVKLHFGVLRFLGSNTVI